MSSYGHGSSPSMDFGATASRLSLLDTARLNTSFVHQGLLAALSVSRVLESIQSNRFLLANLTRTFLLQVILLLSTLIIKPLLAPVSNSSTSFASVLLHLFWLYPLCAASIYFTGLFNLRNHVGNKRSILVNKDSYKGILSTVITESYKPLVLLNYLIFAYVLRFIPYVGTALSFMYCCVANSYYVFESHWIKSNWPLSERIEYLESRWSYFLGFGFPISLVSFWSSDPLVNFSLFSLFYPVVVLMASTAQAQPLDPALPTSSLKLSFLPSSASSGGGHRGGASSFSMAAAEGGEESRGRAANAFWPVRVRVLVLADLIYAVLVSSLPKSGSGGRKKDAGNGGGYGGGYGDVSNGAGGGGWRGDGGNAYGQPQQQQYSQQPTYARNNYAQPPPPSTGYAPSSVYASPPKSTSSTTASYPNSSLASTVSPPPRRTHAASESAVGVSSQPSMGYAMQNALGGGLSMGSAMEGTAAPVGGSAAIAAAAAARSKRD